MQTTGLVSLTARDNSGAQKRGKRRAGRGRGSAVVANVGERRRGDEGVIRAPRGGDGRCEDNSDDGADGNDGRHHDVDKGGSGGDTVQDVVAAQ